MESCYIHAIDGKLKFENFVVDRTNIKAFESSLTCATNPAIVYNPLFIYGKSGIGKTHLLNAIANLSISDESTNKVALISGVELKKYVEKFFKEERLNELIDDLTNLDILLIDDIQFITNSSQTQEILIHVFDNLLSNNKQIVITASKHVEEIEGLEDQIKTRITSGLATKILALEHQTAINIIKTKINELTISEKINDDVIGYLATNYAQDVRTIEGALNRLIFYFINYSESNECITLELTKKAFKDIENNENQ